MSIVSFSPASVINRIKDPKKKAEEEKKWQQRYIKWGLIANSEIAFNEQILRSIITSESQTEEQSAELLVKWAERLGAIFQATDLTTSQIRNFFGEVLAIQQIGFSNSKAKRRFVLLIPKLEYAVGKEKKKGLEYLKDVLVAGINLVQDKQMNFDHFVEFFEAILAYHKAYGGS